MLSSIIQGYRRTVGLVLLCFSILILAVTCSVFLLSLAEQLEMTEILDEDSYLTVVVPNFDSRDKSDVINTMDARRSFQNGGYSQISSVKRVEQRTLAYAYSPVLSPCCVLEHDRTDCGPRAAIMPSSYFVGSVVCENIEMTQGKLFGTPRFHYRVSCEVSEILCALSEYTSLENVTVNLQVLANETLPMEVGKTYLVWGLLSVGEDGEAELHTMHQGDKSTALTVTEDNGVHWCMETSARSGLIIPWISEVNGSLDGFWITEIGRQWQADILSRGDILLHSVKLIGTDLTETLLSFNRGSAYVVAGCAPEDSSLPNGCLISEELAMRSGLLLGDALEVSVYDGTYRSYIPDVNIYPCNYEDMYTPYDGFTEQHTLQIVGLYRTEDDIHDPHAIHPDTVFVKNSLLNGIYLPDMAGTAVLNDDDPVVDAKYSLIIPTGAEELFFSEARMYGIGRDYFLLGDSGYAADLAELGALDRAMEYVRAKNAALQSVICWSFLGTVILIMFALVWSAKSEINRSYGIDTPKRTLLGYLYLRQVMVLLFGFAVSSGLLSVLYRPMLQWWLSRLVSCSVAEQLMACLPSVVFHWSILLLCFAVCAILAFLTAWLGAGRKYHYVYHDTDYRNEVT